MSATAPGTEGGMHQEVIVLDHQELMVGSFLQSSALAK